MESIEEKFPFQPPNPTAFWEANLVTGFAYNLSDPFLYVSRFIVFGLGFIV